jgi:hypothetical protein
MTQAGDSIDSTPVKTGVTAKDLYDASPNNTFRALTSEFTFRVNSSGQTGSEKVPAGEEDSKGHRDAQEGLMDQFKALELVENPDVEAHPPNQVPEEELDGGQVSSAVFGPKVPATPFQYSADSETLPAEPFYEVKMQSSLQKARKLARKVKDCLGDCEVALQKGSSLYKLREEALRLSRFRCPKKRVLGVIGNSGQGKVLFA